MICWIVRVHEDVVQVYNDGYVKQISEDRIKEALKSGRSVSESFWYNPELIGAITSAKSGFGFVTRCDPEKMIGVPEVEFRVDPCLPRRIQEIRNQRKQIFVFLGDPVKPPVVDAKSERAVFLLSEGDRSAVTRTRRVYETRLQILVNKVTKSG
jgi:hypothetical protein